MKSAIIKMDNVTCKGFVGTLSKMLTKVEGIHHVDIDHSNSQLTLTIQSEIPRAVLIEQLIQSGSIKPNTATGKPKAKSCGNCVVKKLKLI